MHEIISKIFSEILFCSFWDQNETAEGYFGLGENLNLLLDEYLKE